MSTKRAELKLFLRRRRAAITPEMIGLARNGRRLTPGLRREEVAQAAHVGVTWYTWLEQGRDIRVSPGAIARIAQALRLSPSNEAYLYELTDVTPPTRPVRDEAALPFNIQALLDAHGAPAGAFDPALNLLARNDMLAELYDMPPLAPTIDNNQLWQTFMNPARRTLYEDWPSVARNFVGVFRANYPNSIGDPAVEQLLATLRAQSKDFATTWDEQHTAPFASTPRVILHPRAGRLRITSMRLPLPGAGGRYLAFVVAADAETAAAFRRWKELYPERRADVGTIAV